MSLDNARPEANPLFAFTLIMVGSPRTGRMRRMMLPLSTRTILLAAAVVTQRRRDGGSETPGECITICLPAARCI
jgi:hypothetical protein